MSTLLRNDEVLSAAYKLANKLLRSGAGKERPLRVWGIPRGGVSAALALQAASGDGKYQIVIEDDPMRAEVFVDDLIESGETFAAMLKRFGAKIPAVLYDKSRTGFPGLFYGERRDASEWLVFPWEENIDGSANDIPRRLLQFIGENPHREGLKETPARFLKAWQEWTSGYRVQPANLLKQFEDGAEQYNEMLIVNDIPFFSHCEHHLAPFFGVAHVAYIPDKRIVGLSKIPRLVDAFARRLQVQERMTAQIADAMQEVLKPKGVAVRIDARHLCMESRGARVPGSHTTTTKLLGAFETGQARQEFLQKLASK